MLRTIFLSLLIISTYGFCYKEPDPTKCENDDMCWYQEKTYECCCQW